MQDDHNNTFPRLQAEAARKHKHQTLLWIPDTLSDEDFEDEAQANWLKEQETSDRPHGDFHIMRSSRQGLIEQVQELLKTLQTQPAELNGHGRFAIDLQQNDQLPAYELGLLLAKQGLEVDYIKESDDPVKNLDAFDQAVRDFQHMIITFGQVTHEWLKRRIERALQIQIAQYAQDAASAAIWVFLPPGCSENSLPKPPPNMTLHYLKCPGEQIDEEVLRPLQNYQEERR